MDALWQIVDGFQVNSIIYLLELFANNFQAVMTVPTCNVLAIEGTDGYIRFSEGFRRFGDGIKGTHTDLVAYRNSFMFGKVATLVLTEGRNARGVFCWL